MLARLSSSLNMARVDQLETIGDLFGLCFKYARCGIDTSPPLSLHTMLLGLFNLSQAVLPEDVGSLKSLLVQYCSYASNQRTVVPRA
jgi:hypothetical protein